ncbi:MAG: metalloregulator ArsR/SmtB family transcription factor [Methanomassiliicoccales archaeon]
MEIPDPIRKSLEEIGGIESIASSLPPERKIEELGRLFQALSDPLRVRILYILKRHPLCVCLIKEITSVPDSKLSYHLGILKEEGLITGKQEGNWIIYRATGLANRMLDMCSEPVW